VEDKVSFLGYQPDPYAEMARSDLLVVSSDREGLPTVLVEALHAGIRIVSTDCGPGVQEILMDGTYGAVVPTNDPDAMAAAIERQMTVEFDPERQRGGGARFEPELIARQFAASIGLDLPI
jgi:glycosyltransferase involved in cell wall biosynthesis